MNKDIRVLIVEDDPYALDLMSLLLTRDWRTRVVGEISNAAHLKDYLANTDPRLDVVVLDTEIPGAPQLPFEWAAMIEAMPASPAILYTATQRTHAALERVASHGRGGVVLKNELLYALASAIALVARGDCVVTPGVLSLTPPENLPSNCYILDGRKRWSAFTSREKEIIRLAMIFNLSIRDMSDELVLSSGWVSEIISTIYTKLGLREILSGQIALEDCFDDERVLTRCREIVRRSNTRNKTHKAPWMSTLAFHLLTTPEIKRVTTVPQKVPPETS